MNNEALRKCQSLFERTEYYDDEGEWRIAGSDCFLATGAALRSWAKLSEQTLGSDATTIMFSTGKQAGEQFAAAILKQGFKDEELKYALEVFLTNGGWGKVRAKVNLQKQEAAVKIRNSIMTRQTKAAEPVCHFIRGYFAGAFSVIFGEETECVETKCKAMGDQFCEFQVEIADPVKDQKTKTMD